MPKSKPEQTRNNIISGYAILEGGIAQTIARITRLPIIEIKYQIKQASSFTLSSFIIIALANMLASAKPADANISYCSPPLERIYETAIHSKKAI